MVWVGKTTDNGFVQNLGKDSGLILCITDNRLDMLDILSQPQSPRETNIKFHGSLCISTLDKHMEQGKYLTSN